MAETTVNITTTFEPTVVITVTLTEYYDLLEQDLVYSVVGGGPVDRPDFTATQYAEVEDVNGLFGKHLAKSLGSDGTVNLDTQLKNTYVTRGTALGAADIVTRGDSITAGGQGGGIHWTDLVGAYLGAVVFNPSVPGEQTRNIATRGGLNPAFTVAGNSIPSTVTPVAVTLVSPDSYGYNGGSGEGDAIGRFDGMFMGVPVDLKLAPAGTWSMTRKVAGSAVPVPSAGARFFSSERAGQRAAIATFWGGKNGGATLVDTRTMVADLLDPARFLVFSILTSGSEPSGSSGHTAILAINATLAAEWPDNYFDMRGHLIANGLTEEGITPTTQDLADIAGDTVPSSLRADDTHPNAAGQRVIARKVANLLVDKDWWPAAGSFIPPSAADSLRLNLPGGTSKASRASSTALRATSKPSIRIHGLTVPSLTVGSPPYRVIAQRWDDATQLSWNLLLADSGKLFFQYRAAGTNGTGESSVALTTADEIAIRADLDATAGTIMFYTSTDDGANWTQLGTTITGGPTGSIASTAPVNVGAYQLTATLARIRVLDGATVLLDHRFSDPTAPDAANWTYSAGAALVPAS